MGVEASEGEEKWEMGRRWVDRLPSSSRRASAMVPPAADNDDLK